jgi:cell division protein ZapE
MQTPLDRYRALLESGDRLPDPVQAETMASLDALHRQLVEHHRRTWYRPWRRRRAAPRGRYLWGGVGRGKTWMMDLFYETLPLEGKTRIHFHRFMARVHEALRERASASDPLADVARDWSHRYPVLCFDEFFVSDIADAMLLGGLLRGLFERGVTLVATSNVPPGDLYRDGLQRARFLPAIELIGRHTEVLRVGGDRDFRLRLLERSPIFHFPADAEAEARLARAFDRMAAGCDMNPKLLVNHRKLEARRRGDGIIWFHFDELCRKPRSAADYIELARAFNTVLLSGVPVLDEDDNDVARRFVHLVDEFYDRNVKLLLTADAPAARLYRGERLAFEFERTASRLLEMQSHEYLARPHLP